jgi:hypothetical protein
MATEITYISLNECRDRYILYILYFFQPKKEMYKSSGKACLGIEFEHCRQH